MKITAVKVPTENVEMALKRIRKAQHSLKENGHSDGCECNLCKAARTLKQAIGFLHDPELEAGDGAQ